MKFAGRVAVLDAGGQWLGFGMYLGDRFRPGITALHVAAAFVESEKIADQYGSRPDTNLTFRALINPMIRLDDGRIVWGYETWWAPAADFVRHGHAAQHGVFDLDRWDDDGGCTEGRAA